MIACGLSLSGAASAVGVAAVYNQYGQVGAGAITSAGTLFGWGVIANNAASTTPRQFFGVGKVLSVSQNAGFALLSDSTLFDLANYSPVTGVSAVKAVIEPRLSNNGLPSGTTPAWYIHDKGNGSNDAKPFMNIINYGLSGVQVQALIGPGFGLSGGVASVVPRGVLEGTQGYTPPGMPVSSWAWATDTAGQLYEVRSAYDQGGNPIYAAPVTGACTATGSGAYTTAVVAPYNSTSFPGNQFNAPVTVQDPVTFAWSCADPFSLSPIATLTQWQGALTGYSVPGISNVVVPITGMSNVVAVADNSNVNTFVARADGTVWAWGGGIGDGVIAPLGSFNPYAWGSPVTGVSGVSAVQVPGATNVVSLVADNFNVYALTSTGQVYAWGSDAYGQLGQGYNNWGMDQALPVLVPGLNNIVSIHPFGASVLALDGNGGVWAWGGNYWGQLGLGNTIGTPLPTKVPGLTGVTSLSVMAGMSTQFGATGGAYAIAGKSDGSVWAWGDNTTGQLGNGTRVSSSVPIRVMGQFGMGFLNIEPAVLDVLVGGVSIMGDSPWNGFNFGNQAINTTSAPQSMTFSNIGMISWTGFTFGSLSAEFAQSNNCGVSLLPGASCTVNFTFTPTLAGVRTASLMSGFNIGNSNLGGAGGPVMTGTGVAPQAVMSTVLGFGTQKTAISTAKVVTLSNAGNAVLTVGTPGVSGAGFTLGATTCGASLAAGASCTLNVNFLPVAATAYTGSLTFTGSNNPGGAPVMALSGSGAIVAAVRGDFNADGKADILWNNAATGQNVMWLMNGGVFGSAAAINSANSVWTAVAQSDFDGDGKSDILWRNKTSGQNVIWFMNAGLLVNAVAINSALPAWNVMGVADVDGDGRADDIIWNNPATRQNVVWLTNSGVLAGSGMLGAASPGWMSAGVGDFNGDGMADIMWRNQATGQNILWTLNGTQLLAATAMNTVSSTYTVVGLGDFNGDSKIDILWRNSVAGANIVWLMNGAAYSSSGAITSIVSGWNVMKVVDFNGDGKTDVMWRNGANNQIWLMNGLVAPTAVASGTAVAWQPVRE